MLIAILICEISFWVAIALGLTTRYALSMPRVGLALLYSTPLIDITLLTLTIIHLRSGAEPHLTHGIAALYIGFSVAFGHQVIEWADRTYRRQIRKEQVAEPRHGSALRRELEGFGRALVGAAVAAGVLELAIFFASNPATTETLRQWHRVLLTVLTIWFITGPVWQFFTPEKQSDREFAPQHSAVDHNGVHGETFSRTS